MVDDVVHADPGALRHHLHQHGAQALADAGCARVDVDLAVLHDQTRPALVGKAHAHARVL